MTNLFDQLQKTVEHLRSEFATLQIGRASAALVEDIQVESYGSMIALKATANISCPDSKTIQIEPWDKSIIGTIEKTIRESSLGINPQNMGGYILLPIPPLTEERRKQVVKLAHDMTEQARISIRNIRHDAIKEIKQLKDAKELSEDEAKSEEKQIQEKIDTANKQIDEISKKKEADILNN